MYYVERDQHRNYNVPWYTDEVQGRDDHHRRHSNSRRHSRHAIDRRQHYYEHGYPPVNGVFGTNFNKAKAEAESNRGTKTSDGSRRYSQESNKGKHPQWSIEKTIGVVVLGVLTFLVIGSLAIGGVALYYAGFVSQPDTYLAQVTFTHELYKPEMGVPWKADFIRMETKFCKGVHAVFGGELKSCTVDGLVNKGGGVVVLGRLTFCRRTLKTVAMFPGLNPYLLYIKSRLEYACYTEFICATPVVIPTLLPTLVTFRVKSNFSSTTTVVGGRNGSRYLDAQASVCYAIKYQLDWMFVECYVAHFGTGNNDQTIIAVTVDHLALRDKTKLDSATLTKGSFGADNMSDELKNIINVGGGRQPGYFSSLILRADAVLYP